MKSPIRQAADRYRFRPYFYYYALGKAALDPAYPEAARQLVHSPHPLLDLGCGMGLLGAYLRSCGHRPTITGYDVDAEKVAAARLALDGENAAFHAASALEFTQHSGDIVILDVLHYFSDDEQQNLLARVAESVAPGGTALIRVTLNEPNWRYAATRLEEWFVHFVRWIPVTGWNFPTREEVSRPFEQAGLTGSGFPLWGMTPFNSYLFVYKRNKN